MAGRSLGRRRSDNPAGQFNLDRDWVRVGRAPLIFAVECATVAWLGLLLVAVYFLERFDARVPVRRPEAVVALAVGLLLAGAGVAGIWRARRMGVRVLGGGQVGAVLVTRELLRTRSTPLVEVLDVGLVRSGVGTTLYCRATGGGFVVHAVSTAALTASGAAPAASVAQELAVRARVARGDQIPDLTDPLPDLAPGSWLSSPYLPPGVVVTTRGLADPAARRMLGLALGRSLANAGLVVVFAVALATTSPRNYVGGIVTLAVVWLVLQAVARLGPLALRLRRRGLAAGSGAVAQRVGTGWRLFDLTDLAGVGLDTTVVLSGFMRRPIIEPALLLVARDGRRMAVPEALVGEALRADLRAAVADAGATVTLSAAPMLAGSAPPA